MRKGQDYVDSLRRLKSQVYVQGERVSNLAENPFFQSTIEAWGRWLCDAAFEPPLPSIDRYCHPASRSRALMPLIEGRFESLPLQS